MRVVSSRYQGRTQRGRDLDYPPLELDNLQNVVTSAKEINCFRMLFTGNFVHLCKYHGINLHTTFTEHCKWAKN